MSDEMKLDQEEIDPEIALQMADDDACEAKAAYELADAWAQSLPGTPYGVTEPVRTLEELEKVLAKGEERDGKRDGTC